MQIQVLKSKFTVKVTGADLNYIGSITIDENPLEAPNIIEGEKAIVNINNERFETYAIKEKKIVEITLNGPAARKVQKTILSISFHATLEFTKKNLQALIIFPNENDNSFNLITISSK
jgi:aspartate 1-decarboxylase